MEFQQNIPLAPLTTLGVGGPARWFAEARSVDDVRRVVERAHQERWPLFILGGGSNLVVADSGWPGLVLRVAVGGVESSDAQQGRRGFTAGAGVVWDELVAATVKQDCAGVECLSGIPGLVGGTPVQNVGAYGQEVAQTITEVLAFDLHAGDVRSLCREACGFSYRTSIFNTDARGRYIILRVTFELEPGGAPHVEYPDLQKYFAASSATPSLQAARDAVREVRRRKAMLIVAGDEDARSAGSFFKNALVSEAEYDAIAARAAAAGLARPPRFTTGEGVKVPAAWLVEQSGMPKGTVRGPVGISRRHALAIVNRGGAMAADVIALKNEIQERVATVFGVMLRPEPVFVGFGTPSS
jgi:UDP-N-acetylmuramate dehydrogenase